MEQSYFENVQRQNLIQYKFNQQLEQQPSINLAIQANPILPQGKYKQTDYSLIYSPNLKSRIITHSTLNKKSIFPKIQQGNKQERINRFNQLKNLQRLNFLGKNIKHDQQKEKKYEFDEYLQDQKLIYKKVENSELNIIGKGNSKFYCSIFLDLRIFFDLKGIINFYQELKNRYQQSVLNTAEQPLKFDSNFESGNLFTVYKKSQKQYDLFMQNDINTKGCTQWFYFSIENKKKIKIRLNILNFYKQSELYKKGMKPLIYSTEKYKIMKQQWKRGGQAVQYQCVDISDRHTFYKLSFTYEFQYENDKVYFSYSYPYTLAELKSYFNSLNQNINYKRILKKQILCKTILNRDVQLYSISQNINLKKQNQNKPIIYVIARQHPGQSPGSFVLQGFVNAILSNRIQSQQLRNKYIFKIVPMINIDGVLCGNYRSNLSGFDVNRKWDFPQKNLQPQIFHLKQKLNQDKKRIIFFLDFHGHSRKMNSFFYGNHSQDQDIKIYPFICSKLNKNISKEDSSYYFDSSKKSTARIVVQEQFSVRKSYTFQVSFYGYQNVQKSRRQHFQKSDYRQMGHSLAFGIYYCEIKFKEKIQAIAETLNIINTQTNNGILLDKVIQKLQYSKVNGEQIQTNFDDFSTLKAQKNKSKAYKNQSMNINIEELSFLDTSNKKFIKNNSFSKGAKYIQEFTNLTFQKWIKFLQNIKDKDTQRIQSIGSDSQPDLFQLDQEDFQQIRQLNLYRQLKKQTNKQMRKQTPSKKMSHVQYSDIKMNERSERKVKRELKQYQIQKQIKVNKKYDLRQTLLQNKKKIQFTTLSNLKDKIFIKNLQGHMHFSKRKEKFMSQDQRKQKINNYNLMDFKKTIRDIMDNRQLKSDKQSKQQSLYQSSIKNTNRIRFGKTTRDFL